MFQPGHAGECKITNYGSLGTSGTKCEKLMRCVCWNGHGRMHKKPKCKYETSTAGGSSLATLDEFMAKLHNFPDDLELAPFLDEIAKDEQYAKTICQSCAVHVLYQRNPGVCMKPYKHKVYALDLSARLLDVCLNLITRGTTRSALKLVRGARRRSDVWCNLIMRESVTSVRALDHAASHSDASAMLVT